MFRRGIVLFLQFSVKNEFDFGMAHSLISPEFDPILTAGMGEPRSIVSTKWAELSHSNVVCWVYNLNSMDVVHFGFGLSQTNYILLKKMII